MASAGVEAGWLRRCRALLLGVAVLGLGCSQGGVEADAAPSCEGRGRSQCVAAVSLGQRFGCALLYDQTVWCWGRNDESQLGYESADLCPERLSGGQSRAVACHSYPLQVQGLGAVTALSAGGAHSCAIVASGALRCWGANTRGQLGRGSALPSRVPVDVVGLGAVRSVAAGLSHTCAVTGDGSVYCWGSNERRQLGVETAPQMCEVGSSQVPCARVPVRVEAVSDAVEVVAGDAHACARTSTGRVYCWGTNVDGQLGAGTAGAAPLAMPQVVLLGETRLRGVTGLSAGANHTCATRDDGAVLCWGRHDRGQLGVAVPSMSSPCANACVRTAVPIAGYEGAGQADKDSGFEDFDASLDDAGAAPRDGALDAGGDAPSDAGARDSGARDAQGDRTGDGPDAEDATMAHDATVAHDAIVLPDVGPPSPVSVAAGGLFSCLSLSDGTVRCWGSNRAYELGNGLMNEGGPGLTTVIASPGSAATNPLQGVTRVSAGLATSCAVLSDRSVRCWGSNELGALGVGNMSEQNGPVAMTW
ncbi:MAG: hypothetical protein JNK72_25765 [Myxococcales bacterium]|nr:hypothetical protein [Myxococcales bacterium]